ncbi:hypothetical protein NM688_g2012 [Phlebia brevispora]|uniref:Uncharacterized protein n=1 Tax=Phlebia brevispora TaxID=194682 RepID=A0ACC1T9V7_9APHY|nr:hypothetical protein NM688_g2012 [Phlebia brevispora]
MFWCGGLPHAKGGVKKTGFLRSPAEGLNASSASTTNPPTFSPSARVEDMAQPAVLTIAGTDSSGGAGIQADLKTFTAHNCYGTSVVTALTAQNTTGVQAVHPSPPEFIEQQLRSVLEDIDVKAMKTGMLYDASSIRAIVKTLKSHYGDKPMPPLVCDPVCVSTSGHALLQPDAVEVMISELFPLASLITPNKSEAELILSCRSLPSSIDNLEEMLTAAKNIVRLGPKAVLVKGGHMTVTAQDVEKVAAKYPDIRVVRDGIYSENMEILQVSEAPPSSQLVVDVLQGASGAVLYLHPRIDSTSTHGTGCTLSAAIICGLSRGHDFAESVRLGTAYTHLGIELAQPVGKGHGPLNHMHSIMQRSVPSPTRDNPHPFTRLLIQSTAGLWKQYVEHEFVKQLGKGTLPRECFLHFIKTTCISGTTHGPTDTTSMIAAKSDNFPAIKAATDTILNVIDEVNSHKTFCAQWGITEEELLATPESPSTTAYGAYILDCGLSGDRAKLVMAVAACLLGYGEVGLWLKKEAAKPGSWVVVDGNPYAKWMDDYGNEHYQAAVKRGLGEFLSATGGFAVSLTQLAETIETIAVADPPSPTRFEEWKMVWTRCAQLEKGFWDMALHLL